MHSKNFVTFETQAVAKTLISYVYLSFMWNYSNKTCYSACLLRCYAMLAGKQLPVCSFISIVNRFSNFT